MEYKNLATSNLVDKCTKKDPIAWSEFVRRFYPLIVLSTKRALATYASSPHLKNEVNDIAQDIMISVWGKNKLLEIRQRENINYWLAITARNATVNHLKTKQKEILLSDETLFKKIPIETINHEADHKKNDLALKKTKEVYASLPPKQKLIFQLYFKQELKLEDISKMLNIPSGTISSIVTRIRKRIKE